MEITNVHQWSSTVQDESVPHVRVIYSDGNKVLNVHEFGEKAAAAPEFYKAFDDLSPQVVAVCCLPVELQPAIKVRSVKINPKDDKNGDDSTVYTICGTVKAGHASLSFDVSVNHKHVPEGFTEAIDSLIENAGEYVDGKRGALDLFKDREEIDRAEAGEDQDGEADSDGSEENPEE